MVPCLTAMTASYGRADQKGAVMGTLRSLGSLARAVGPLLSSFGTNFFSRIIFIAPFSNHSSVICFYADFEDKVFVDYNF